MNFSQVLRILRHQKDLIIFIWLAVVAATATVSLLMPKTYIATTALVVDTNRTDSVSGVQLPERSAAGYMATQADIIGSRNVALKVAESLTLAERSQQLARSGIRYDQKKASPEQLADALLERLDVKPSRESSVLNISYAAGDPALAAEIANAFAQTYIQTVLELRIGPARQSAQWFDKQLTGLRGNLERAQQALSDYQTKNGLINIDERLDEESTRLTGISEQLVTVQSQTYASLSRQRQLEQGLAKGNIGEALPEIGNNPVVQALKAELTRAEAKLTELSERLDRNHPQYERAMAEVTSLKARINAEIKTATASIVNTAEISKQHETELKKALAQQKARVMEHQRLRDGLVMLTREVENAQRAYDGALQRLGQTRMESESNQTNVVVLNAAAPPLKAARPKTALNIAFAFVFGGLLALGVATLIEKKPAPVQHTQAKIMQMIRRVT